jgi:cell division protein ZapA
MSDSLMSNQAVEVEILGKLTRVACPPGQEQALINAAKELDRRLKSMSEKTQVLNAEKLLTIAALNACYELLESQKVSTTELDSIENKMAQWSQQLDAALNNVTRKESNE